jgi:hypothetical protein
MRSIRFQSLERASSARSLALCATLLAALAAAVPGPASADAVEDAAAGDPENHLIWAARVCYLEAGWRESDCIALLYVAQKRAERVGRPWLDVLHDYSALSAKNGRAREVRAFPWGDIAGKPTAFNRRWQRLRALVVEVASGQHKDPCPRAEHWGGTMDRPRGNMIKARCAAPTANTFYAVRGVRK